MKKFITLLLLLIRLPVMASDAADVPQFVPQLGHQAYVGAIAVAPDGKTFAASDQQSLTVWQVSSGDQLLTLDEGIDRNPQFVYSPDSRWLASLGGGRGLELFDTRDGHLRWRDPSPSVSCLTFSRDGQELVTLSRDGDVIRLSVLTGRTLTKHKLHTRYNDYQDTVVFSAGGKLVAIANGVAEGSSICETDTGEVRAHLEIPAEYINLLQLTFSPDGSLLAGAALGKMDAKALSLSDKVLLWDAQTGRLMRTIAAYSIHGGSSQRLINTFAFAPDGKTIATTGMDPEGNQSQASLKLWDTATGQLEHTFPSGDIAAACLAWTPDGRSLLAGTWREKEGGSVQTWDITSGRVTRSRPADLTLVHDLGLAPDGKVLMHTITPGIDDHAYDTRGDLRVWDSARLTFIATSWTKRETVHVTFPNGTKATGYGFSSPQAWTFATAGKTLVTVSPPTLWSWPTLKFQKMLTKTHGPDAKNSSEAHAVALSPEGQWLAVVGGDPAFTGAGTGPAPRTGTLQLWNVAQGSAPRVLADNLASYGVAFSSDSKIVAALNTPDTERFLLWDVASGTRLPGPEGKFPYFRSLAWASNRLLLVGGENGGLLWDVQARKSVPAPELEKAHVLEIAPHGDVVAIAQEETISLRDVRTWREVGHLPLHWKGYGLPLAFSRDGRQIVSGDSNLLRFWNPADGQLTATMALFAPAKANASPEWIAWTPQGFYDCSSGAKRFGRWRVGDQLKPLSAFQAQFHSPQRIRAAMSPLLAPATPKLHPLSSKNHAKQGQDASR